MAKQGLPSLMTPENGLEKLIISHVSQVPTDRDLEADYGDRIDRRRVRDRRIVCAVFDAIFEHLTNLDLIKNVETELDGKPDIYSVLASVRRHLAHDTERLDQGDKATDLFVPAQKESLPDELITDKAITSKREILILWLVAGKLWSKEKDAKRYPSRNSVFKEAEKLTTRKVSSFNSELSHICNDESSRFSKNERDYFNDLIKFTNDEVETDGIQTALALLLPAVRAISATKIS